MNQDEEADAGLEQGAWEAERLAPGPVDPGRPTLSGIDPDPVDAFHAGICYSPEDQAWVSELHSALEARGLQIWLDEQSIDIGDSIPRAYEALLRGGIPVILVLPPETGKRGWPDAVRDAAHAADLADRSGRLLPVLLPQRNLPPLLKGIKALEVGTRPVAEVAAQLERRLRAPRRALPIRVLTGEAGDRWWMAALVPMLAGAAFVSSSVWSGPRQELRVCAYTTDSTAVDAARRPLADGSAVRQDELLFLRVVVTAGAFVSVYEIDETGLAWRLIPENGVSPPFLPPGKSRLIPGPGGFFLDGHHGGLRYLVATAASPGLLPAIAPDGRMVPGGLSEVSIERSEGPSSPGTDDNRSPGDTPAAGASGAMLETWFPSRAGELLEGSEATRCLDGGDGDARLAAHSKAVGYGSRGPDERGITWQWLTLEQHPPLRP